MSSITVTTTAGIHHKSKHCGCETTNHEPLPLGMWIGFGIIIIVILVRGFRNF